MARLIIPLLILTACIPGCKPDARNPRAEAISVYRDALEQIIFEYLLVRCVSEPYPGFAEKAYNDYVDGKIDSGRYAEIWDSLFTIRKDQLPKCVMEYSPLFDASRHVTSSDVQCSMACELHDDFYYRHFQNARVYGVIDTLVKNTTCDWKDLSPPYMDFVKYDSSNDRYGSGRNNTAVIALSTIYFNKDGDHAILYFEFAGGHQYQRGALMFLEKTRKGWKAKGFRTIWIV